MLLFTRSMRAKQLVPGATDEGRERLDAALVLKVPALGNDVLIAWPRRASLIGPASHSKSGRSRRA
jgi:hypothetical protein